MGVMLKMLRVSSFFVPFVPAKMPAGNKKISAERRTNGAPQRFLPVRSLRNKKGDGVGKADAGGRVVG